MNKTQFVINIVRGIRRLSGDDHLRFVLNTASNYGNDATFLEVGTYYGVISAALGVLSEGTNRNVFVVDPFLGFHTDLVPGTQCHYLDAVNNWKQTGAWNRITPFTMESKHAISLFKLINPRFDLIFLDGDHNYETVIMELKELDGFLNVGGVMSGDDCNIVSGATTFIQAWSGGDNQSFDLQCVSKAVVEFFRGNDRYQAMDTGTKSVWAFQKIK